MNITEASKILGLSQKTLRRHVKKGAIQAKIIEGKNGKEYDINPDSLEAFKSKQTEQTILPTVENKRQELSTLPSPSTLPEPVSMEGFITLIDKLNSFLDNLRALDRGGQGKVEGQGRVGSNNVRKSFEALADILTVEEVAAFLSVSSSTVRGFLKDGTLHGVKLGRGWKISKGSLEKFVRELLG